MTYSSLSKIDKKIFKALRALFVYLGVSIMSLSLGCASDGDQTDTANTTDTTVNASPANVNGAENDSTLQAVIVTIFSKEQEPIGQKFTQICRGANEAKLDARRGNRIIDIPVSLGEKVRKGEVIIQMDSSVESSALQSAIAAEKSAQVAHEKAQRDMERAEAKFKEQLISASALENTRSAAEAAEAMLEETNAAVALARQNLRDTKIVSPIDGEVTYLPYEVGETPGISMTAAEVSDRSAVILDIFLSESLIREVSHGDSALVHPMTDSDRTYVGHIRAMSPKGDDRTQLFKAELYINNHDNFLRSGMTLTAELFPSAGDQEIFIPIDAIQFENDSAFVVIVKNGSVSFVTVSTGRRVGASAALQSAAISDGDTLVIVGAAGLVDDQKVRIVREVAFDSLLN